VRKQSAILASILLAVTFIPISAARADEKQKEAALTARMDRTTVDRLLADWPNRPKLAANRTIEKYGLPDEATDVRLVWHNKAPWKRIMVVREEIPHYFPRLHVDYLYQTINYHVPPDRSDDLVDFDGSVLIDRTKGELTSRCDREEANILTLNLANDIVTGRKKVSQAKQAFVLAEAELLLGKMSPLLTALQFPVPSVPALDPGKPQIPGSPLLSTDANTQMLALAKMPPKARMPMDKGMPMASAGMSETEIMAFNATIDLNEIDAATDAEKKAVNAQVRQFARMIHTHHGTDLTEAMMLAARMKAAPLWTPAVDQLRRESAGKLAPVVRLDGPAFDRAWIDLMVEEHTKALSLIDGQLLPGAKNKQLREHLTKTRSAVASHLEEAKRLQASLNR
jgi:predicted outer membrane protein